MTGYAGSRDYVGNSRRLHGRPYAYLCIPLKSRLRPSREKSVRVNCYFKLFATRAQNSCERVVVCFLVGCVDMREVVHEDCGVPT